MHLYHSNTQTELVTQEVTFCKETKETLPDTIKFSSNTTQKIEQPVVIKETEQCQQAIRVAIDEYIENERFSQFQGINEGSEINAENNEAMQAMDAHFNTSEFAKSMSRVELDSAIFELSKLLPLSDEEAQSLAALLTHKNNQEIELLNPIFNDGSDYPGTDEEREAEYNLKWDAAEGERRRIQDEFTQAVGELLSQEQFETYQAIEQEKIKVELQRNAIYMTQELYSLVPDLDESQKDQVKKLFNSSVENGSELGTIEIGSFGTYYRYSNSDIYLIKDIDSQLEHILSSDQLNAKEKAQAIMYGAQPTG